MAEEVRVFVNKKELRSPKHTSVGALHTLAGFAPGEYALEERGPNGHIVKEYKDPSEKIELHEDEHFTTKYIGPIQPSSQNGR